MDLDQAVEVEAPGLVVSSRQPVAVERGDDQQDGVRAGERRLVELVAVDDEVLLQDRELAGAAGLAQVVDSEPPKWASSVSTERAAAPPSSYARASSAGSAHPGSRRRSASGA